MIFGLLVHKIKYVYEFKKKIPVFSYRFQACQSVSRHLAGE
jgi:hypothetical protein